MKVRQGGIVLIGPALGIAVFWLLDSKFLIPLLYTGDINLQSLSQADVTPHGVAITSALAGLLGYDLIGKVTGRFDATAGDAQSPPGPRGKGAAPANP